MVFVWGICLYFFYCWYLLSKDIIWRGLFIFFVLFCFEKFLGYKKFLKLEFMILRLIIVIIGFCYSRKSCSFYVRLNMKGFLFKGILKVCFFCKGS